MIRPPKKTLRKKRLEAGMTQAELGHRCGISKFAVCTSERKGIKTIRLARRYAAALNCDPLDLLD